MPKGGFEVDLGDGSAPAPATAAKVFGLQQEAPAPVTQEVAVQEVNNMTVDSPKELWDVMGHVSLSFHVTNHKEVIDKVAVCVLMWDELRKVYAAELNAANTVSDAQLALMKQLAKETDSDLPEGYEDMGKAEASTLISSMLQKRGSSSTSATVRTARQNTPAARTSGEDGISAAQLKFINQLCKRKRIDLPEDIEEYSKKEASALIEKLNG